MRSRSVRIAIAVAVALVAMGLARILLRVDTAPAPSQAETATVSGSSSQPLSSSRAGQAMAPQRSPLPPQPAPDFDSLLEQLVVLGTQLSAAVEEGDRGRSEDLDRESRSVLEALQQSIRDPEERALHRLTGLDPAASTVPDRVRRSVLLLLVAHGIERRVQEGRAAGSMRRRDSFVSAVLDTLPLGEQLARELGAELLVGSPHVGLRHEEAVLDLVDMSDRQFLHRISTDLLLTLWNNLRDSGARSNSELASVALLFKDSANPSKRLAALTYLVTAQEGRYRSLILDEITTRRERGMARELGLAAALALEPTDALAVLQRVATITTEVTSAFVTLAQRDPRILRTMYESKLADNLEPGLRAELITGMGFSPSGDGMELARLAFQADPDPAVRTRAMFVLTSNGGDVGEEVLNSALGDAEYSGDPRRLGEIVVALENLAGKGMTAAVQRLGTRLMSRRDLLPGDRERLAKLLSR